MERCSTSLIMLLESYMSWKPTPLLEPLVTERVDHATLLIQAQRRRASAALVGVAPPRGIHQHLSPRMAAVAL